MLPDVVPFNDLNKMIAEGATELNRGISTSNNVPAQLYARELLLGTLYPGTLSAMGNGIHLATPSKECKRH